MLIKVKWNVKFDVKRWVRQRMVEAGQKLRGWETSGGCHDDG